MDEKLDALEPYRQAIERSKLTIYDDLPADLDGLWVPSSILELALDAAMRGTSLAGLPLRTRSRVVKEQICRTLGYPVPPAFQRTRPRFPGQNFDVYVQKSNNLQIWNEDLETSRRYVVVRVGNQDQVTQVKVVTGEDLAKLDTTGTLTRKYQARLAPSNKVAELLSDDTDVLSPLVAEDADLSSAEPTDSPRIGELLPIHVIFDRLKTLIGGSFPNAGVDQERNRGAALHQLVCKRLGYPAYGDDGRFPDIPHQLLEVKLQTSPTIDLGLVNPSSIEQLDMPHLNGTRARHCDVRYAMFGGTVTEGQVELSHFLLTTGEQFFDRFAQFQGKVVNEKIQIRIPSVLFTRG